MGMFDSFLFKCIFCGEQIEDQTKSGPCMLEVYRFEDDDLPPWVMEAFDGSEIDCYKCGRRNRIVFDLEIIVKRKAIEPVDNLDYLELKSQEAEEKDNG